MKRSARVPFTAILKELVEYVDGAEGAILLEADGEAVQWFSKSDVDQLKLRAAYIALTAQSCKEITRQLNLSSKDATLIAYHGASFLVSELESDYMVILVMDPSANIGKALYKIKSIAVKLQQNL
jgi:predicted regulator of Ras-like GTPase activity (Roadblock/LC7/MglB family)